VTDHDDGVLRGTARQRDARRDSAGRSRSCLAVLVAVVVLVGAGGYAAWLGTDALRTLLAGPEDFSGQGSGEVMVQVIEGDTASDVAVTLERAGVVASVEAFTEAARRDTERSTAIQPGFYALAEEMSAKAALEALAEPGNRIEIEVALPEGLTAEETFTALAKQSDTSAAQYRKAAENGGLGLPDYADGLEGYLFPATYALPPRTAPVEVLRLLVGRFRQAAAQLKLEERSSELGYTPAEVVTVASLVQAEARRPDDFAKVAAVIYNRLDEGMPLQLDSTVQYASGGTGVFTSDEERDNPSLYNTYRHSGLPPGPIDAPGEQALEAALAPVDESWTYFVTVNLRTGETLFSDSYREHRRNVEKLRRYCTTSDAC
jgi:UPF0755 protein